jgi:hypothetical protein
VFVYSKKIIKFIDEIKKSIKEILSKELGLRVHGDRFYDKREAFSYPIRVVIYNNKRMLGYFDPDFFELGFHELLMFSTKEQLRNIIRHELAHYLTCMSYGSAIQPHGPEFRALCMRHGWGEEVYKATTCLDDEAVIPEKEENAILRKVHKLMSLATSNNEHEAEQAMIKSQQLLLKYNIDSRYMERTDEERVFLKRILKQKKENAKMRSIARILETFFVNTIYSRSAGFIYLEIVGSEVNIEIAEYVAAYLDRELEILWEISKQKHVGLKGAIAKNSFFLGIAKGYCNKIHSLKREYSEEVSEALMVIEKKLIDAKGMIYSRLRSSSSNGRFCRESSALGEQVGKQLKINPAIGQQPKIQKPIIAIY